MIEVSSMNVGDKVNNLIKNHETTFLSKHFNVTMLATFDGCHFVINGRQYSTSHFINWEIIKEVNYSDLKEGDVVLVLGFHDDKGESDNIGKEAKVKEGEVLFGDGTKQPIWLYRYSKIEKSRFKNQKIKISGPVHSRVVQSYLFTLGYDWSLGEKAFYDIDGSKYINTHSDGTLTHGSGIEEFEELDIGDHEIDVEEIKNESANHGANIRAEEKHRFDTHRSSLEDLLVILEEKLVKKDEEICKLKHTIKSLINSLLNDTF